MNTVLTSLVNSTRKEQGVMFESKRFCIVLSTKEKIKKL